jgi:cytochrome oxidase Cu insertion factor (SCO1/SenC/PrrC family)
MGNAPSGDSSVELALSSVDPKYDTKRRLRETLLKFYSEVQKLFSGCKPDLYFRVSAYDG